MHGLTTFVGEASDAGRVASVSFLATANAKGDEVVGLGTFSRDLDLSHLDLPLAEGGGFVATDKAGNKAILAPTVVVDKEADKPIVEIHAPSEMEVLRGDFVISGVAYGYVGVAAIIYRLRRRRMDEARLPGTGFSVPWRSRTRPTTSTSSRSRRRTSTASRATSSRGSTGYRRRSPSRS